MKLYQNLFNEFEEYITPSDVIQYVYCPRFIYFMKTLSIRQYEEKRFKVQEGRKKHSERMKLSKEYIRKRIDGVSKEQEKYLISKKYGIKGIIDEVYLLEDGTYAPLDYKFSEYCEKEFDTSKTQMAIYSILIEELYKCKVSKFYLVYIRSNNLLKEIKFDDLLRKKCIRYIEDYKNILNGYFPKATGNKKKCIDCTYKNLCTK